VILWAFVLISYMLGNQPHEVTRTPNADNTPNVSEAALTCQANDSEEGLQVWPAHGTSDADLADDVLDCLVSEIASDVDDSGMDSHELEGDAEGEGHVHANAEWGLVGQVGHCPASQVTSQARQCQTPSTTSHSSFISTGPSSTEESTPPHHWPCIAFS
jgi:hypothetical protein